MAEGEIKVQVSAAAKLTVNLSAGGFEMEGVGPKITLIALCEMAKFQLLQKLDADTVVVEDRATIEEKPTV